MKAIGLMSGTSMDGVDVALIETDGEGLAAFGPTGYRAYDAAERALLRRALGDAVPVTDRAARPGVLAEAEALVTRAHAEAVESFLAKQGIARSEIEVVGFHGQTVLHRPERRLTVQIGDGAGLAARIGLPVVADLRAADVAAGGQGAPLVPIYHRALVKSLNLQGPVVVLNVGGVANITWLDGEAAPVACDTGPANAPIDDLVRAETGAAYDAQGAIAARGRVDEARVAQVLAHPFFALKPPKSLDRQAFATLPLEGLGFEDKVATATAVVAASVARVVEHLPEAPRTWVVAGGGARNPTLLAMLRERVGGEVITADALGWSGDALEAQAFAFLAVRSLKGLPLTFPTTTGVPQPLTGGVLHRAA